MNFFLISLHLTKKVKLIKKTIDTKVIIWYINTSHPEISDAILYQKQIFLKKQKK